MYNRYIPQHDGSYKRQSVFPPAQANSPVLRDPPPAPIPEPPQPEPERCHGCSGCRKPRPPKREPQGRDSCGSFLRSLLPGNFDTEDLLVIVLLLLMSGENREDGNLPLLTLALYLFL